jgi:Ca-activated chloride channel family protein
MLKLHRSTGAVLLLTGVLALSACSSGAGHDQTNSDAKTAPGSGAYPQSGGGQDAPGLAGPEIPGGETEAALRPQSTFALDVDTASYSYALRQLQEGHWPEPSTLRAEEFVNSFAMGYPQPSGNGFGVHVDGAALPATHRSDDAPALRLLRVGLQTRGEDSETRKDVALTFVIDTSGSMAEPGRLDLVQDALHYLVRQLRPTDAVALVTFNDRARIGIGMTSVRELESLDGAINRLTPGGSTNLESGLVTGYQVARDGFRSGATNRVILLSDGLANVGNTEADPILRRVRAEADKQISLLGVGVGSQYGDSLMERLADKGDGYVLYVANRSQARDAFVKHLPANISLRALDAKAQVTFDSETVDAYRLVGYDDRRLSASAFRNDRIDGGEVGAGHAVTALYIVRLRPGVQYGDHVADVDVRWQDPVTREPSEVSNEVSVGDVAGGFGSGDPHLRLAYAAAFFAEILKSTPYATGVRLSELETIAADANEDLNDPKVGELVRAIGGAARIGH